jgi:hypothetical protein
MRSVSGSRNRVVLVVASLLTLAAAAWLASAPLGLADRWPQADALLPHADATPAQLASLHQNWLLPAAVAVTLGALLAGVCLLIAQVPARPTTAPLRVTGESAAPLGSLDPAVLDRALAEHVENINGVLDASVQMTGTAGSPWVQASVTIAEDAETAWVADTTRKLLADDLTTVFGTPPRQVDLLLRLRPASAPSHAVAEVSGPREEPVPGIMEGAGSAQPAAPA